MNSIRKTVAVLGLLGVVAAGAATRAEAAPILSIQPVSQIVGIGDTVVVDILVSNVEESLGAFDVDVSFSSGILTGVSFAVDPDVPENFINDFAGALSGGFSGGTVNIAESGDPSGANAAAAPGSPQSFRLGRINFMAAALGQSALTFSFSDLSNELGTSLLQEASQSGFVCVAADPQAPGLVCPQQTAPEPATLFMLGGGIVATAALRSRRRRQSR